MEEKEKKIAELKSKIEKLQKRVDFLRENRFKLYFEIDICGERAALEEEIFQLEREILLVKGPVYTNGVLDLYLEGDSKTGLCERYNIALTGTTKFIGSVRVNYEDMSDNMFGNIGYGLNEDFRGNGYMLQALEILRKPMIKKGLKKPIITVEPDNKPSVKTIENFGGKKLDDDNWYDSYEVDLKEKSSRGK